MSKNYKTTKVQKNLLSDIHFHAFISKIIQSTFAPILTHLFFAN